MPEDDRPSLITPDSTVGALAARYPQSTRVFSRHGLDFCCSGGKPLQQACDDAGANLDTVLAELASAMEARPDEHNWSGAPLADIIEHILERFHAPLREELPRLKGMARKVVEVHGDKDPRLARILETFVALETELGEHMLKEERILFPMILRGEGALAGGPVAVMEDEHESAGAALRQMRALTSDFVAPEGACTTWKALWHGLESLESDMHQHIHLENNILFPRALGKAAAG